MTGPIPQVRPNVAACVRVCVRACVCVWMAIFVAHLLSMVHTHLLPYGLGLIPLTVCGLRMRPLLSGVWEWDWVPSWVAPACSYHFSLQLGLISCSVVCRSDQLSWAFEPPSVFTHNVLISIHSCTQTLFSRGKGSGWLLIAFLVVLSLNKPQITLNHTRCPKRPTFCELDPHFPQQTHVPTNSLKQKKSLYQTNACSTCNFHEQTYLWSLSAVKISMYVVVD